MKDSFNIRWLTVIIPAIIATVFTLEFFSSEMGWFRFEPLALDAWFNVRGEIDPPDDIVIIAMDAISYDDLGIPFDQPWPRSLHAELLERLSKYGVKRVVFDILFLGESSDPEADMRLARAMTLVPTVIGAEYAESEGHSGGSDSRVLLMPYEEFAENVESVALVGYHEDYGKVRRFYSERAERVKDIPSLAEAAAGIKGKPEWLPAIYDFLNIYGPPRTIETISYQSVLQDVVPLKRSLLENKIVFVGLALQTGLGPTQKDTFQSPFHGEHNMYGIEFHATAASNLLAKDWIKRGSSFFELCFIGLATFVFTALLFALPPLKGGALLLGVMALWSGTSHFLFLRGFFLPVAVPVVITLPLTYLCSTLYFYVITRRAQRKAQRAFELYLSPDMARQVSNSPELLAPGGEKLCCTALFTDIAGFTSITESMEAEEVSEMLNSYYTGVIDLIFENKGTLIKFIGDAVFVIWGAPVRIDNHAEMAAKTAIAIKKEVARFNRTRKFPMLLTRIGLHTGPMMVGNLGSKKRVDYTAIGDSVNLASRVEALNKYFGTDIMMTGSVKERVEGEVDLVYVGKVSVVGKEEVVSLYSAFSPPIKEELIEKWKTALTVFENRMWDRAREAFEEVLTLDTRLKVAARLYISQIDLHIQDPPGSDWKGEIVFEKK